MPASRSGARSKDPAAPKLPAALTPIRLADLVFEDDGVHLSAEFTGTLPTGTGAEDVEIDRCRFDEARLPGTVLRRARLTDVEFTGCDLANITVADGLVFSTALDRCRLTGSRWTECGFRDVTFTGCRADLSRFRLSRFRNVVFRDCNLTEADFQGAEFTACRFEDCRLQAAQFSQAKMMGGTRFSGCDLSGLGGVQDLRGAVLSTADVHGLALTLASALGITVEA